jgi:aminopeptidase N
VPLVDYGRNGLTDLSYSVGALFFDVLYRLVGPEQFNAIIGRYYTDYNAHGGSTKDLVEVMRKTVGIDLSQLVTDWLYTTAWADRIEHTNGIQEVASYYGRDRRDGRK